MRINNNVMAMNAHRYLSSAGVRQSKSLEKISSGLRINSAADDAAGLAISEKMRAQINGLEQAETNAQNGISLIQTAEGALNETHSILQRMRQLAVNSSNDTNTETDRAEIQKEVDELATELSRISDTTEFNTENLLNGDFDAKFHIGANAGQKMELHISDMSASELGVEGAEGIEHTVTTGNVGSFSAVITNNVEIAGNSYTVTSLDSQIDGVGASIDGTSDNQVDQGTGINANYYLADESGDAVAISSDGVKFQLLESATAEADLDGNTVFANAGATADATTLLSAFDFKDAVTSGDVTFSEVDAGNIKATGTHNIQFSDEATLTSGTYTVVSDNHALIDSGLGLLDSNDNLVATSTNGFEWNNLKGEELFSVNTSNAYEANDTFTVSSDGGIDVSSQTAASNAITVLDDAISTVSGERSKLGAYQNRLEHTINNLSTTTENLQASESRIRDVDVAKEMMEFTKLNILAQASQSMLAQANQAPQGVLQLLG